MMRFLGWLGALVVGLGALNATAWNGSNSDADVSYSLVSSLVALGPALLVQSAVAVLAVLWSGGVEGAGIAFRAIGRRERAGESALAAHVLLASSRATIAAGLVLGLLSATSLFAFASEAGGRAENLPAPALVASAITLTIFSALVSLVLGRMLLGAAAEAAHRRAGLPLPFGLERDLALLAQLIPSALAFVMALTDFRTL